MTNPTGPEADMGYAYRTFCDPVTQLVEQLGITRSPHGDEIGVYGVIPDTELLFTRINAQAHLPPGPLYEGDNCDGGRSNTIIIAAAVGQEIVHLLSSTEYSHPDYDEPQISAVGAYNDRRVSADHQIKMLCGDVTVLAERPRHALSSRRSPLDRRVIKPTYFKLDKLKLSEGQSLARVGTKLARNEGAVALIAEGESAAEVLDSLTDWAEDFSVPLNLARSA